MNKANAKRAINELSYFAFPSKKATTGRLVSLGYEESNSYLAVELESNDNLKHTREELARRLLGDSCELNRNWLPRVSLGRIPAKDSMLIRTAPIPAYLDFEKIELFRSIDRSERIDFE